MFGRLHAIRSVSGKLLACAALAAMFVVAGCGGSSSTGTGGTTPTANASLTACKVSTSWPRGGGPVSGSGPANASEDRQPAAPRSNGSAAAEAASTRRLGTMSDTRASYHVRLTGLARLGPVLSARSPNPG